MNHLLLGLIITGGCAGPPAEVVTSTQPVGGAADRVVAILTGHLLKDPGSTVDYHTGTEASGLAGAYANRPVRIEATVEAVERALEDSI